MYKLQNKKHKKIENQTIEYFSPKKQKPQSHYMLFCIKKLKMSLFLFFQLHGLHQRKNRHICNILIL